MCVSISNVEKDTIFPDTWYIVCKTSFRVSRHDVRDVDIVTSSRKLVRFYFQHTSGILTLMGK